MILVTGATGNIGSRVVGGLSEAGDGRIPFIDTRDVVEVTGHPPYSMIQFAHDHRPLFVADDEASSNLPRTAVPAGA